MNTEEFNSIIDKIVANRENQGLVTELATQVKDSFGQFATTHDTLAKQVGEYEGKIDELQKHNMNLYLKQGQKVESQKLKEPEPLTYDDLIKNFEGGSK